MLVRCRSSSSVQIDTSDRKRAKGRCAIGEGSGSIPERPWRVFSSVGRPAAPSPVNVFRFESRKGPFLCVPLSQVLQVFYQRTHQTIQGPKYVDGIKLRSPLSCYHHQVKRCGKRSSFPSEPLSNLSANPVSHHRIAHRAAGAQSQTRIGRASTRAIRFNDTQQDELRARSSLALTRNAHKILRFEDPAGPTKKAGFLDHDYLEATVTARRFRPFARRLFKIVRPERVFIRSRKPCLRSRLIRLGW